MASNGSGTGSSTLEKDQSPLWQFVVKGEKCGPDGGNLFWKCTLCGAQKQGTLTRVKAHLLNVGGKGSFPCKGLTIEKAREMSRLQEEYEARRSGTSTRPRAVPLPSGSSIFSQSSQINSNKFGATKKRRGASDIEKSFDNQARSVLDCIIARMFFTSGLPFSLVRNPNYVRAFTFAANSRLGGYVPPGYNRIRTTLLENEKKHVELSLAPIKSKWGAKGVTIVSDGWSDPSRRPLINFIVCSESGPMFMKAVDCSGEVKGRDFIARLLREVIIEVGDENVVQVITDNASNCKAAGEIIEGYYPHIYWTPCVVHTLNLALKNICAARNITNNEETYIECHWITEIHSDAVQIKNFIVNHDMRLSMYMRFSALKLLSVAETRFASVVIMLKRFKLLKNALESMVVCDQWTSYRDDDQVKARFVRDTILNEDWWDKVDYILAFTNPIYDMIRVCDTDKLSLHLVYEMWDVMIEKVKRVIYEHEHIENDDFEFASSTFYDVVHTLLVARWTKSSTPFHCLAHTLNPRNEWLVQDTARKSPHMDDEVSVERRKCFKRLFPCPEDYNKVFTEYGIFSLGENSFGNPDAIERMYSMDPKNWWANFGMAAPLLQGLAIRLLGQPTSSSCAERNWCTYSFINSVKRNKLLPKRAEDLVFIHNNLRLLSRNNSEYLDERTKSWDISGDQFGSLDDTSILEVADLSIDAPEMESVFFEDDHEHIA